MIRLLIVDDSPLMRRLLSDIFEQEEDFTIATARDGEEAITALCAFCPDVVTLDVHMPGMDGLQCLDTIMLERPTPVVMISALTAEGAEETLSAIALGAIDFVPKPSGAISLEIETLAPMLVEKVRMASAARLSKTARLHERVRHRGAAAGVVGTRNRTYAPNPSVAWRPSNDEAVVLIGTSTGGPPALEAVLSALPATFPWPILIAQHMPSSFTGQLARRLDKISPLSICEVTRLTRVEAGHVYIGRGDADMIVSRRKTGLHVMATPSDGEHLWHPSVDRLVESAVGAMAADRLIGVLMTGMGADGAISMAKLRGAGGMTIAEAEETAIIWGMPGALVQRGGASLVLPLDQIAQTLVHLTQP